MVGGLVTGGIECRGAVPAQTVGVLPGTPGSSTQAHRRSAVLLGAVVSTIQLESGIDDRQTGDPNRLASQGVQAVLAVEVALGKTADCRKSSPADCAHGAGEPDLGRGAHRSRTVGEARDLGFATNGAGVLAARERSEKRSENILAALADFVRNHAKAIVAGDFLVAITAGFRALYVFVVMEVGSRRILQCNVTAHPIAAWTLQQFREAIPSDHTYRFLIHDRDSIFSAEVDDDLGAFGLKVLRTPVQAPQANAYCERLVGTIRRECLDYVDSGSRARPCPSIHRHELPADCRIGARDVLGGLHHEY